MKISLIATVLNAEEHIGAFLASIAAQTRRPDEIVIVDGGSTDGTVAALRAADGLTLLEEPGANISRGRNVAIAHAAHDVVAVADADCVYGPGWLAALVAPIEDGADVSMGWTEPIVDSVLAACVSSLGLPLSPDEVDPATFMPSARSVAYRRDALEAVGGYPEWLAIGEDMWVNHRWRERPFDLRFAPEAVAAMAPACLARCDLDAVLRSTRAGTRRPACIRSATRCASPSTAGSWRRSLPVARGRSCWWRVAPSPTPARRCTVPGREPRTDVRRSTLLTPALLPSPTWRRCTGYAARPRRPARGPRSAVVA